MKSLKTKKNKKAKAYAIFERVRLFRQAGKRRIWAQKTVTTVEVNSTAVTVMPVDLGIDDFDIPVFCAIFFGCVLRC